MKRDVLEIPLEEIERHLQENERQDIKIVAPSILTQELFDILTKKGKKLKQELPLLGNRWPHSNKTEANKLCESSDFKLDGDATFTISFVNQKAAQEEHYHKLHTEIYFSEHSISGYYRHMGNSDRHPVNLTKGGLVLFGPNIVHYMKLNGLTLVLELPAVDRDRYLDQ